MNEIVKKIIDEKTPVYFVSPHLDDAALSCGGLISYLADKTKVTVITVFTSITPCPYTLSAKAFLKQCNAIDPKKLYMERRNEDEAIFSKMGVEIKHLGFVDAQWRKKEARGRFMKKLANFIPELFHVYPIYRWHIVSGKVSPYDAKMIQSINKKLKKIIKSEDKTVVFCPAAIGNHVDHVITRDCCLESFDNFVLWSDFPYDNKHKLNSSLMVDLKKAFFSYDKDVKKDLIKAYKTQFDAMFPGGKVSMKDEIYMFNVVYEAEN